ncbi:seipin-like [Genypterus blacodes]|uniref:seipin-like n=1 Tax=Genypterus blacodes TaxID=154954 RepID=UPI003F758B7B
MDREPQQLLYPQRVRRPSGLVGPLLSRLQDAVVMAILRTRKIFFQTVIVAFVIFLVLWLATFLYGSFYFSYMPKVAYSTPVHYYYRTDCESQASFHCSYPVANVSLTMNKKHVLTFSQAYRFSLVLEMPDSLANQELGMFMIRTTCFSQDGDRVTSSHRSSKQQLSSSSSRFSMLRYRSDLLRIFGTLLLLPAFLTGVSEQSQVLEVELFSEYVDDPYSPSVSAVIEILSNKVQIYSSQLNIHAHLTGIRYLLFNFPISSALVGVLSNFTFLSTIFILSFLSVMIRAAWTPGYQLETGLPHLNGETNSSAGSTGMWDALQITPENMSQEPRLHEDEGDFRMTETE